MHTNRIAECTPVRSLIHRQLPLMCKFWTVIEFIKLFYGVTLFFCKITLFFSWDTCFPDMPHSDLQHHTNFLYDFAQKNNQLFSISVLFNRNLPRHNFMAVLLFYLFFWYLFVNRKTFSFVCGFRFLYTKMENRKSFNSFRLLLPLLHTPKVKFLTGVLKGNGYDCYFYIFHCVWFSFEYECEVCCSDFNVFRNRFFEKREQWVNVFYKMGTKLLNIKIREAISFSIYSYSV